MLRLDFVTLFPDVIEPSTQSSILARAASRGIVAFRCANPRDFTYDRNHKVDDAPYGGEPGMLLKAEPVALAIESLIEDADCAIVLTDPAGVPFRQSDAEDLATRQQIIFLCGHYEGIDHRVVDRFATHSFSIGDYVLTNGELPALVMADAITRLLPGVLGDDASLAADSHHGNLLSAPNFTRPDLWRGVPVPDVLLSGNHAAIAAWRAQEGQRITQANRPDLLAQAELSLPRRPRRKRSS